MIHAEHPFADLPEDRDPVRRFRGRLANPVTIITSGERDRRTGLTVSSLFVAEGEPGRLHAVVGPNSDLWDVAAETERFVVHVCRVEDTGLAEVFAGLRPSPGGLFAITNTTQSKWGPLLDELPDRMFCSLESRAESGNSGVFVGVIDNVELSDIEDPLVHFRGTYRTLTPGPQI
ncbi:MAG: flavin reductase family protein [Acidimicrobiia bacterium]